MAAIPCTPNDLLAAYPCAACLSKQQILAVIALTACKLNAARSGATCDANTILTDSKCFECMSEHQLLEAAGAILLRYGIDQGYVVAGTNLTDDLGCLLCVDEKKLWAYLTKALCDFIAGLYT